MKVGDLVAIDQYGRAVPATVAGANVLTIGQVTHVHEDKYEVDILVGGGEVKEHVSFDMGGTINMKTKPTTVEVMKESLWTEKSS